MKVGRSSHYVPDRGDVVKLNFSPQEGHTVDQAFAAIHVCQWLSNCYPDIHLFRYDSNSKQIVILAGETLVAIIPPSGDWGFENE